MKALALGVIQDLRDRRLLPVAMLLAGRARRRARAACSSPPRSAPPPVAAAPVTPAPGAEGLPTPEQALQGGGKPLVSLAVLDQPSDLASFDSKDPFKPLEKLADRRARFADSDRHRSCRRRGRHVRRRRPAAAPTAATAVAARRPTGQPGPRRHAPAHADRPRPRARRSSPTRLTRPSTARAACAGSATCRACACCRARTPRCWCSSGVDAAGEKAVFLVDSTVTMRRGRGQLLAGQERLRHPVDGARRAPGLHRRRRRALHDPDRPDQRAVAGERRQGRARRAQAQEAAREDGGRPHAAKRRFTPPVLAEILTGVQQ